MMGSSGSFLTAVVSGVGWGINLGITFLWVSQVTRAGEEQLLCLASGVSGRLLLSRDCWPGAQGSSSFGMLILTKERV